MIAKLVFLLAQAAPPPPTTASDLIVVGHRAEHELVLCLARNCSPAEEVEAALQASVEQFTDGRYHDARLTLKDALRRNRDHEAELPGPISTLYATLATVAEHEGDSVLWLASARDNVMVLERHLGEGNIATLGQKLALADALVALNKPMAADAMYREIQQTAAKHGQIKFAAGAIFRRAWLALNLRQNAQASRLADEAVVAAGADNQALMALRDVLRMRISVRNGDEEAVDALAVRLHQPATQTPRLLFAPPIEDINSVLPVEYHPMIEQRLIFADVGYWVRPDGRTAEAEILRTSGVGQWTSVILKQVSRRRYVPLDAPPGDLGIYRIDRFTVRGKLGTSIGSRLRQAVGRMSVHVVDLTETEAMTDVQRKRMKTVKSDSGM